MVTVSSLRYYRTRRLEASDGIAIGVVRRAGIETGGERSIEYAA